MGPGSGLCCGYTMMRAILSDAIALVRGEHPRKRHVGDTMTDGLPGDRFYTTDYTRTLSRLCRPSSHDRTLTPLRMHSGEPDDMGLPRLRARPEQRCVRRGPPPAALP